MTRHFKQEDIRDLIFGNSAIETIKGEDRRWSRSNTTIVELEGKYYAIVWEQGLTEKQENDYPEQDAKEVKKVEKEIKKIITEWVEVD